MRNPEASEGEGAEKKIQRCRWLVGRSGEGLFEGGLERREVAGGICAYLWK